VYGGQQDPVVDAIDTVIQEHGYPPTLNEIGRRAGLGPQAVSDRLMSLERQGLIDYDPAEARAIRLVPWDCEAGVRVSGVVDIPLMAWSVAAGSPLPAEEQIECMWRLPEDLVGSGGELFILRISGDSMVEAGVLDGDYVIVRRQATAQEGDIVVALLEDEATVKYFSKREGRVQLLPANEAHRPIPGNSAQVVGLVVALLRRLQPRPRR
jgi:repressor LexA